MFSVYQDGMVEAAVRQARFDTLAAAERRARTWARRYPNPAEIYSPEGHCIARAVLDGLGRVWTDVTAVPGQPTLL